VCTEI